MNLNLGTIKYLTILIILSVILCTISYFQTHSWTITFVAGILFFIFIAYSLSKPIIPKQRTKTDLVNDAIYKKYGKNINSGKQIKEKDLAIFFAMNNFMMYYFNGGIIKVFHYLYDDLELFEQFFKLNGLQRQHKALLDLNAIFKKIDNFGNADFNKHEDAIRKITKCLEYQKVCDLDKVIDNSEVKEKLNTLTEILYQKYVKIS